MLNGRLAGVGAQPLLRRIPSLVVWAYDVKRRLAARRAMIVPRRRASRRPAQMGASPVCRSVGRATERSCIRVSSGGQWVRLRASVRQLGRPRARLVGGRVLALLRRSGGAGLRA